MRTETAEHAWTCAKCWRSGARATGRGLLRDSSLALIFLVLCITSAGASDAREQTAGSAREWPLVGGDWSNQRFSRLAQINQQTVQRLGAAWVLKFDEGATSSVTPVMKHGLVFVTAGRKVYAINARTGERIWSHQTISEADQDSDEWYNSPNGVPNRRGVAASDKLVFVGLMDGHVIALDQRTGERVWVRQTGINERKKGQWASAAPVVVDGTVYIGLSDGERDMRGRLTALEASTGRVLWQTFAVPSPGEPGHDSWPALNDSWIAGGGGIWTNAAVDSELSMVFVTTGNPSAPYAGDERAGDNLFTSSVIALDAHGGAMKWYFQLVRHDVFEGDAGTPLILYDAQTPSGVRKALGVIRADGYIFQFDRRTGEPLLPLEERPVPQLKSQLTSPTQPFPAQGESVLMSCAEWRKEALPKGFQLGCMWTPPAAPPPSADPQNVLAPVPSVRVLPMAYSPQTQFFYALGTSALSWPRRAHDRYFSGVSAHVPGLRRYFELAAIDSRTGRIAWKKHIPSELAGGGPLVTAGGLLFRSSGDGHFEAFDARTGEVRWQYQTPMTGATGSPASYELDGTQYITVPMGNSLFAFKLDGSAASSQAESVAPLTTSQSGFEGPIVDTEEIETAALHHSLVEPGKRYFVDEFAFNPYRARVKVGSRVLFVNNGLMPHEMVAEDGSWSSGLLHPTQQGWVSFPRAGMYPYGCRQHPWSHGQIVVVEGAAPVARSQSASSGVEQSAARVRQGRATYNESCRVCHGESLQGVASAPALIGAAFIARWQHAAVGDLLDRTRTTMPQSSPGSLKPETYLDVVTYLLQENGLTIGHAPSDFDAQTLRTKKIGDLR